MSKKLTNLLGHDLSNDQLNRFYILNDALADVQLSIRQDSDLCWNYILHNHSTFSVQDIVQRLCQAEYLHKYCDFQQGYINAQNIAKTRYHQGLLPLPKQQWHDLINSEVLKTTPTQKFPEKWPWM